MSSSWGIHHRVDRALEDYYGPGAFVVDLTPLDGYSVSTISPDARVLINFIELKLEGSVRGRRFAFQ